jgi:hypothetical protein
MSHICPCTPCPSPQGYRSKVESRHFAHHWSQEKENLHVILHLIVIANFNKNKKFHYPIGSRGVAVKSAAWQPGDRVFEPSIFRNWGGEPGGPVQNILLVGGGGGLSSRPGQEVTHGTLHTSTRPKELSAHHLFSGLEDADNTSLAFNITCPRSHFHTGSDVIVIALIGITVRREKRLGRVREQLHLIGIHCEGKFRLGECLQLLYPFCDDS